MPSGSLPFGFSLMQNGASVVPKQIACQLQSRFARMPVLQNTGRGGGREGASERPPPYTVKKIPTIFERDWNGDRSRVLEKINPECDWVFAGDGVATRKYDGTAVLVLDRKLYCRYDAKNGKQAPAGFIPAQMSADPETGHWPGWIPAEIPQHKWQIKLFERMSELLESDETYEACGPHFQGNPEHFPEDTLVLHGSVVMPDVPRTFAGLSEWFKGKDIEGIVWHHGDGRMAKIKKRDFGLKRDG